MIKPRLVLSSTTSFFFGGIRAAFQNAAKYGFKYLEIIPYRWSDPQKILELQKKYGVKVAGIHLTQWWGRSVWQMLREKPGFWEKLFVLVWQFYLGDSAKNPGWQIAQKLDDRPYLVIHADVAAHMGENLKTLARKFNLAIENLQYEPAYPKFYWHAEALKKEMTARADSQINFVFDPGHFGLKPIPPNTPSLAEAYQILKPEVVHVGYHNGAYHTLPNPQEQEELKKLLQIHPPRYLVLETNPLVSIQKSKKILENILNQAL